MWVAVGMVAAAAIGYAASSSQADASVEGANIQARAAQDSNQLQWDMFLKQQENQKPWLEAGKNALNQLSPGLEPGGKFATTPQFSFDSSKVNILQDPGYQFRMQSGVDALTAAGSAMGNLGSGNLGTALTRYGQDYGSQEYGAAYNREYGKALDIYNSAVNSQTTDFNRLASIAGVGQTAANNLTNAGLTTAGQIGQNMIGAGNAMAAGQVGAANAWAEGLRGVGNQIMGGVGAYNQNQMYQNYLTQQQMSGLTNQFGNDLSGMDYTNSDAYITSEGGWY